MQEGDWEFPKKERSRFFAINITGANLQIDELVAKAPFEFDEVDRERGAKKSLGKIIGDPYRLSMPQQVERAEHFLRQHRTYFEQLSKRDDVGETTLHLAPRIDVDPATVLVGLFVPESLVKLLASLRISVGINVIPCVRELPTVKRKSRRRERRSLGVAGSRGCA